MEVSNWTPPVAPPRLPRSTSGPKYIFSPLLLGLFGTLLLHGFVLQSALFGFHWVVTHPPDRLGMSAMTPNVGVNPLENLTLIILVPSHSKERISTDDLGAFSQAQKSLITSIVSSERLPYVAIPQDVADEDRAPAPMAGDIDGQMRLLGLYTGQIQARISRAWRKPRSPVAERAANADRQKQDPPFRCRVQIVQDISGNVQEILLPNCHGSIAWQRSLVIAIQEASPLPAPPDASVFSRTVNLEFVGFSFGPGAEEWEYESEPRAVVSRAR